MRPKTLMRILTARSGILTSLQILSVRFYQAHARRYAEGAHQLLQSI